MLLPLMLLLVLEPETAVDAERAFNRVAQTEGQWTAFRRFSTPRAVMFVPQTVRAHEWLPRENPPIAVQWWPAESYVSCDGKVAVNTGPWVRPRGFGYFTTIWVRQPDGHFKWIYDGGDSLATPRALPEEPKVRTASCKGGKPSSYQHAEAGVREIYQGYSPDHTLLWTWVIWNNGSRHLVVRLWNGRTFDTVLQDDVKALPAS